jgi:hypothetical protein
MFFIIGMIEELSERMLSQKLGDMISCNEEIEKCESIHNIGNLSCRADSNYKVSQTRWQCSLIL